MTTLNVSLPKSMKTFVEAQLKQGGYSTASEYVRELIREAQKQADRQRLERMLLEGFDSGPPIRVDDKFWKQRREKLSQNLRRKKSRKCRCRSSFVLERSSTSTSFRCISRAQATCSRTVSST